MDAMVWKICNETSSFWYSSISVRSRREGLSTFLAQAHTSMAFWVYLGLWVGWVLLGMVFLVILPHSPTRLANLRQKYPIKCYHAETACYLYNEVSNPWRQNRSHEWPSYVSAIGPVTLKINVHFRSFLEIWNVNYFLVFKYFYGWNATHSHYIVWTTGRNRKGLKSCTFKLLNWFLYRHLSYYTRCWVCNGNISIFTSSDIIFR